MPYKLIRRIVATASFSASGTVNLAHLRSDKGRPVRVIGVSCRVITAANGTGTLSIGTTSGGATALMTTTDVDLGAAGRKTTATGAALAGNGTAYSGNEYVTATYTRGTDTNTPTVRVVVVAVDEGQWNDLMVV